MFSIGDTFHLSPVEQHEDPVAGNTKYRAKLIDVKEGLFVIDPPVNEDTKKTGFFTEGTQFEVWFVGKDGAVYSFHSEVKRIQRMKLKALLINNPGREHYTRIQRRDYVRIQASLDVAVHSVNDEFPPFVTSTIDVSGGGMAISLPRGCSLHGYREIIAWISLHLEDESIHYINSRCRVVRVNQSDKKSTRDSCSLQFKQIGEHDRQKIIRYCFEQQRHSRLESRNR
ncbi:flagellar brake protein [Bacillus piscicola]|uniref:flagellar brake protein n=1 Tax=Bacillus piscicola TaxID=1632684 RepID=UPI001F08FC3C|nr:PilZ domain-containing protein [Bacillus piscicola]